MGLHHISGNSVNDLLVFVQDNIDDEMIAMLVYD